MEEQHGVGFRDARRARIRTMRFVNTQTARSFACLWLVMSSPLLLCCGCFCSGLDTPLTGVVLLEEARRVLGFWPDQALGAGGCDCCLLLWRVVLAPACATKRRGGVQQGLGAGEVACPRPGVNAGAGWSLLKADGRADE